MAKWNFKGLTVYGENFSYTIKAGGKQEAMQKGIEKVKAKYNCNSNRFDCKLIEA